MFSYRMGCLRGKIGACASNIHAYASSASAAILSSRHAIDDEALDTWRAFLNAHAHVTRADRARPGRGRAARPRLVRPAVDALPRSRSGACASTSSRARSCFSPTAMSRFVDRAERAGVVRREPDPHDRRALQVALTDEGVALLRRDVAGLRARDRGALRRAPRGVARAAAAGARARRRLGPRLAGRERQLVVGDAGGDALGPEAEALEQRLRR